MVKIQCLKCSEYFDFTENDCKTIQNNMTTKMYETRKQNWVDESLSVQKL